jgi:uncharacterized phage protein (TIGR01671 family)
MREIKFRAWNLSDECMQSWHSLWTHSLCQLITDQRLILMQYTGLKDKNGKEIYEGDCLGGSWGDGHIGYCDNCKSFEYFMNEFGCASCEGDVHWSECVEDDGKLEVVGNIYENPELLEAQK